MQTTLRPTVVYQLTKDELDTILQDAIKTAMQAGTPLSEQSESIYTDNELQEIAKVSRVKLWKDRKAGRLPFIRIGNMIRYRQSDVDQYLKVFVRK